MHIFGKSLAVGKRGEALLLAAWPELIPIPGGRKGDFTLDGVKVELKTDSYKLDKTENFFIERWSDVDKKKPGGPWQSKEHEAVIFVYFYSSDMVAYIFNTVKLVKALEGIIKGLKPVNIPNIAWTTVGYKVPREALKHLYQVRTFNAAAK